MFLSPDFSLPVIKSLPRVTALFLKAILQGLTETKNVTTLFALYFSHVMRQDKGTLLPGEQQAY